MELIFFGFGVSTAALVFFILNLHFRRFIEPMQKHISELQDLYNSMNTSSIASFKFYDESIRNFKAAPKAPQPPPISDEMVLLNQQQEDLKKEFLSLNYQMKEMHWGLAKETHERLKLVEGKISELSPVHMHWHREARNKRPLLPKGTPPTDIPQYMPQEDF